jgi:tRNA threonylcarbamoyl adenosine modification protein (Sua5/YciO/YrdC/YwlC family)
MPPRVIDLRNTDDTRDIVHITVQALAEGRIVAFPTESVYVLAAGALHEKAVAQLRAMSGYDPNTPLTLAVKSVDEALDFVPNMDPLGKRLARRCWPGPVTLIVDDRHPEGLLRQLPIGSQRAIAPEGRLGLRVPAHQLIQDVLRLQAGPIVMVGAGGNETTHSTCAADVVERHGDKTSLVLDDGKSRFGQPSTGVSVIDGRIEVVRPGVISLSTLKRLAGTMVLFICTGNTCRSPMAEALFRDRLAKQLGCPLDKLEEQGFVVMSAGIAAMPGGRAAAEAHNVMSERGLDLQSHESQSLTDMLVRNADLLITMTRSHRHAIVAEWPEAAPRVKLLCMSGGDIADPIGGPVEAYRRCADQIGAELDRWVTELLSKPAAD